MHKVNAQDVGNNTKSKQEINEKNADDEVEFLQELNFLQEFIRDDEIENGGHNQSMLIKTEQEQGVGKGTQETTDDGGNVEVVLYETCGDAGSNGCNELPSVFGIDKGEGHDALIKIGPEQGVVQSKDEVPESKTEAEQGDVGKNVNDEVESVLRDPREEADASGGVDLNTIIGSVKVEVQYEIHRTEPDQGVPEETNDNKVEVVDLVPLDDADANGGTELPAIDGPDKGDEPKQGSVKGIDVTCGDDASNGGDELPSVYGIDKGEGQDVLIKTEPETGILQAKDEAPEDRKNAHAFVRAKRFSEQAAQWCDNLVSENKLAIEADLRNNYVTTDFLQEMSPADIDAYLEWDDPESEHTVVSPIYSTEPMTSSSAVGRRLFNVSVTRPITQASPGLSTPVQSPRARQPSTDYNFLTPTKNTYSYNSPMTNTGDEKQASSSSVGFEATDWASPISRQQLLSRKRRQMEQKAKWSADYAMRKK